MKKLLNTYQEYHRDKKLAKEYGFPPENAAIAIEEIKTKFGKDLPEIVNRADGWTLVIFLADDARHADFQYYVLGSIKSRVAEQGGDV